KNIITVIGDWRYSLFLLIMIGFWTMFNQLFYTLPNFIEQWVDTRLLLQQFQALIGNGASILDNGSGEINPEMLINFDSAAIVIFQVLISTLVMKFKPLNTMMTGILISTLGVCLAFATQNSIFTFLGIFVFALGEMSSSPKFTEYIGRIAPADKAGLYMGTSFLPIAAGNYFAGKISGVLYQGMSDKYTLLKLEVTKRGLNIPEVSENFTLNNYYDKAGELMHLTPTELTLMLWDTYNPSQIWNIFAAIGGAAVVALFLYDRFIIGKIPATVSDNQD
ncbi:MAG: hypothetical protein RIS47_1004, partial [Bacteroidota bacterium]